MYLQFVKAKYWKYKYFVFSIGYKSPVRNGDTLTIFFFFLKVPHTKYLKEIYTGKQDAYGAFNINNEGLQTKDALFIPIFEPPFF